MKHRPWGSRISRASPAGGISAVSSSFLGVDRAEHVERTALVKSPGYAVRAWQRFRKNRLSLVSLIVFVLVVIFCFGAPLLSRSITKQTYYDQNLGATFAKPGAVATSIQFGGPQGTREVTSRHWLGTDELGRDVLTRLAYGGRISLTVSFLALAGALTVGLLIGAVAGFYGGIMDSVLMRLVDAILSIPNLFILILISALVNNNKVITATVFYRKSGWLILPLAIAVLSWTGVSRLVRAEFLTIKSRDYVDAARVLGASNSRIILRHILPNVAPIVIIWATLVIPGLIITEASLSYLGFGVQIPTPSWGNMLSHATEYVSRAPFLVLVPGAMIYICVMAISLVGNGLRDALDPQLND